MVALTILTIGVVGMMSAFQYIHRALQASKNHTLAANLAQEKMQILKQKSYYQVLVTTNPVTNSTDFAPETIKYDTGYFPPEYITEGGVTYTRYTCVQSLRENSGALEALAPNVPDLGMKSIVVTVAWLQGGMGKRKVTLRSVLANPNTVMANAVFNGVVRSTDGVALNGAFVNLVESAGYGDTTDSLGRYNINTNPSHYTLMASSHGYYSSQLGVSIAAGATQTHDFSLMKMATGKITGYPWLRDHLVISQIVGSTCTANPCSLGYDQEYVEVFNPTDQDWPMDEAHIGFKFRRSLDSSGKKILVDFISPVIPSGGYYLFANTTTIVAGGAVVDADAVWSAANTLADFPVNDGAGFDVRNNVIPVDEDGGGEGSGGIELCDISSAAVLDRVGWNKDSHPADVYEGHAIAQSIGLSRNELYARMTNTGDLSGVNWNFGPAYDSNDNNTDFHDYSDGIIMQPHNSGFGAKTVIAGTPAAGAVVTCTDGLSASTEAVLYGGTGGVPSYAYFSLVDVATGSWTVLMSSGGHSLEVSGVTITNGGDTYAFPSTATFLTQSSDYGIITGKVVNALGVPLNGFIVTAGGANSTNTGADGRYRLMVAPGAVNITANPTTGGTASYVTASSSTLVDAGQVHSGVNFALYQGGRISGFITRDGINPLPGVAVAVLDANGNAADQQVSGVDGVFTTVVLSTGYYKIQPVVNQLESSTPEDLDVLLLSQGVTQFSSNFTISGALGSITGTVKSGGQPIKTGVLIVVTTATLTGTPPAPPEISSNTAIPYYMVSSIENGTYTAEVRQGTYTVYAYYPTPSGASVTIVSSNTVNIPVTAGQEHPGVNFSW
jgi:hypothetical protein